MTIQNRKYNLKDMTGKTFGRLKVLSLEEKIELRKPSRAWWICKCKCGQIKSISGVSLRQGTKSCGCLGKERVKERNWKGYGHIPHSMFSRAKIRAKASNIEFNITIQDMNRQFNKQNGRCALSGEILQFTSYKDNTASLDRIDSSKGYTKDNIQWVHKRINMMKQSLSDTEFINWCRKVASNEFKTT